MLYDEARMALTKERLEDLRKEKKLSFEQLSKQLAERGVNISHTNLKNYEINDSEDGTQIRLGTKKSKIAFLKLMNDAFLHSELTKQWYDASAKDNITQGAG